MLPRPTDIDVDGRSQIFISSWRGAAFTYAGPNVGYVIRVTHPARQPPAFPDLKAADDARLVEYLASPSQVLRLAAQREILRRGNRPVFADGLEALARAEAPGAAGRGDLHARATARPRVDRNPGEARRRPDGARVRPARPGRPQGRRAAHSGRTVRRRPGRPESPGPAPGGRRPWPAGQDRGGPGDRRADGRRRPAGRARRGQGPGRAERRDACLAALARDPKLAPGRLAPSRRCTAPGRRRPDRQARRSRDDAIRQLAFKRSAGSTTARPTTRATGGPRGPIPAARTTNPSPGTRRKRSSGPWAMRSSGPTRTRPASC